MSFFNFDYDPNNPRVGDRVIVVGDERLNQTAEENELFIPWFTQHRGGEFYIRKIVAGSIYLSSPFTNSIDNYTWSPNWLAPAPMRLERVEHVRVALTARDGRYTSFPSWTQEMEEYVGLMLVTATETAHNGCIRLSGARRVLDWIWNREWLYIVPEVQRTAPRTRGDFRIGDTVMVLNGHLGSRSFGNKGVITAVGVDHCAVRSSTKPRMNHAISYSRLMLLARDSELTYEPNDARLLNEA